MLPKQHSEVTFTDGNMFVSGRIAWKKDRPLPKIRQLPESPLFSHFTLPLNETALITLKYWNIRLFKGLCAL